MLGRDLDAEAREGLDGEVHVGPALQAADHHHSRVALEERGGHEEAGDVLGGYVAGDLEAPGTQPPAGAEREAAEPREVAAAGDELVGERCEWTGAQAPLAGKGGVGAERAGDGQHEAEGGAGLAAVERLAAARLQDAERAALGDGMDLESAVHGVHAGTQGLEAAHGGLDVGAGGVQRHVRDAVRERRSDDQAVGHRLGRDGGDNARERAGGDDGTHVSGPFPRRRPRG